MRSFFGSLTLVLTSAVLITATDAHGQPFKRRFADEPGATVPQRRSQPDSAPVSRPASSDVSTAAASAASSSALKGNAAVTDSLLPGQTSTVPPYSLQVQASGEKRRRFLLQPEIETNQLVGRPADGKQLLGKQTLEQTLERPV